MDGRVTWKPVKIDGKLLATEAFEDLIGIEECSDYDTQDSISISSPKRKSRKVAKPRKRKKVEPILGTDELKPSKYGCTGNDVKGVDVEEEVVLDEWGAYKLPDSILKALADQGFTSPTHIQALTLPAANLGRKDILGAAETGSGKTLAFGIPILTGILKIKEKDSKTDEESVSDDSEESDYEKEIDDDDTGCVKSINLIDGNTKKPLYALILTPTRELAMQVKNHLMGIAKYTGINVAVVVGGMAAVKQERILSKGPEIVVATPGRLWELVREGNSHLSQIDGIRFLAIDETDRMLEKGHFQELHDLLERINMDETKRRRRQNFVFSATLTLVHELPLYLKNRSKLGRSRRIDGMSAGQKLQKIVDLLGMNSPKVVDITEGKGTSETLTECKITCPFDEKDYYVYYFLKRHPGRTLIFCNSIGCVKRLSALLSLLNCHPLPLHASMQQRQRLKNLERFRDDENSILVATDVAARGLDIPRVQHVLHYQTPRTSESYVHRSGRTARASRQGLTLLLIEPNELGNYLKLCRTLEKNEDLPNFPIEQDYLNAVKQRVNLARELDKIELQVKKINSESGWLQKAAEEMDILVDDFSRKYDGEESRPLKKTAEMKRKQLSTLLSKPIVVKNFNSRYPIISDWPFRMEIPRGDAVDLVKNSLETTSRKNRKRKAPIYKAKKKNEGKNKGFKGGKITVSKKKDNKTARKFKRKR